MNVNKIFRILKLLSVCKVSAVGVASEWGVWPLVGVRVPLNASVEPLLTMHNPTDHTIQVNLSILICTSPANSVIVPNVAKCVRALMSCAGERDIFVGRVAGAGAAGRRPLGAARRLERAAARRARARAPAPAAARRGDAPAHRVRQVRAAQGSVPNFMSDCNITIACLL